MNHFFYHTVTNQPTNRPTDQPTRIVSHLMMMISYVFPAEVYPASIRATGHGVSAGVGKLGALLPTVLYNYIPDSQTRFWIVCWFGLAGFILTLLFIPDTTGEEGAGVIYLSFLLRVLQPPRPGIYLQPWIHTYHLSSSHVSMFRNANFFPT